ncbi:MAG: ribosome assembly cofactor RimP [Bacteroidales bacterium]|nr:ribosome assembly cofactor RimP [Bacteroidales bacterium]
MDVFVSKDNDVTITVEKVEGTMDLEDCVEISRLFEAAFDREKEDYSITVSSAGLDQPFKVLAQYQKAVGEKVEVMLKGGRKFVATLGAADEEGVLLGYTALEAAEGSKKKVRVNHEDKIAYSEINSVKPYITFE